MKPTLLLAAASLACAGQSPREIDRSMTWHVPAVELSSETISRVAPGEQLASLGALITIDSSSLRPVVVRPGGHGQFSQKFNDSTWLQGHLIRPATITTYQGARYHPETIRALSNDTVVMVATANLAVYSAPGTNINIDFQGATSEDLPGMVEMVRAMRNAARRLGKSPVAMIVPADDTVAYPTSVLGRVADILIVRLHGEHRPGTAPGPLATPELITRGIGLRVRQSGASRLGAELPLYGYRWNRDGTAAPITWMDAQTLLRAEALTFRRDPPSQFLTATGRDGWTVWVPDAQTVRSMIAAVKRRGITTIALAGIEGADPGIIPRPDSLIKR